MHPSIALETLRQIQADHPDLDPHGFERFDPCDPVEPFSADDARAFEVCLDFLSQFKPTKTWPEFPAGSYGLKHDVEDWSRRDGKRGCYVANGVLIAALIYSCWDYRRDGPNVEVKIRRAVTRQPRPI